MEIILLLLGNKQGDSEQHGCFSLVLFTPPHSTLPIQSSNKHTTVCYYDGDRRIRHTFILAYLIYI